MQPHMYLHRQFQCCHWKNFGKTVEFSENFRKFWRDWKTFEDYEIAALSSLYLRKKHVSVEILKWRILHKWTHDRFSSNPKPFCSYCRKRLISLSQSDSSLKPFVGRQQYRMMCHCASFCWSQKIAFLVQHLQYIFKNGNEWMKFITIGTNNLIAVESKKKGNF